MCFNTNDLQDVNSTSQVGSTTTQHVRRAHETSARAKIYLDALCVQDGKCLAHHPHLIDVVEGFNDHAAACANGSTCNNLPVYAANLGKERDCLHKQVNMPNMHSTTINEEI